MKTRISTLILLTICAVCSCVPSMFSAPQISGKEREQKLLEKQYEKLSAREDAIKKELSTLQNHPWAGEYNTSDGLTGRRLFIAPRTGFSFLWHCCTGPCDLNYGKVKFEDGLIKITSELTNHRDSFEGIDATFYPILWGNRHYLIAEDEMIDFCNSVNSGSEPAVGTGLLSSRFLVKAGDEAKRPPGLPPIPAEYKEYLLSKPITAEILSIDSNHLEDIGLGPEFRMKVFVVAINSGYSEGVRAGMEFHTTSKDIWEDVEVTQVSEHSCKGEIRIFPGSNVRPVIGWQLSTRRISDTSKGRL